METIEQEPGARSGATWSGGGELRRRVAKVAVPLAVMVVLAGIGAGASWTKDKPQRSYLSASLAQLAKDDPKALVRVIVQSDGGTQVALNAAGNQAKTKDGERVGRQLDIVGAV